MVFDGASAAAPRVTARDRTKNPNHDVDGEHKTSDVSTAINRAERIENPILAVGKASTKDDNAAWIQNANAATEAEVRAVTAMETATTRQDYGLDSNPPFPSIRNFRMKSMVNEQTINKT